MINEGFAADQIDRLRGLRFFPTHDAAILELALALQEVAQDEEHASELIGKWIRNSTDCPTPSHIYAMRQPVRPKMGDNESWVHDDPMNHEFHKRMLTLIRGGKSA